MPKTDLKDLSKNELEDFIAGLGEKSFRASQLWNWIYARRITDFEEMTNISKPLREKLAGAARISGLVLEDKKVSKKTGTQKFLWKLGDGKKIESVYIPERERHTVCISTQVGCQLGCDICATARLGFKRNLHVSEIVNQVTETASHIDCRPTNIVVMGMGEPFKNYHNLIKALCILNDQDGLAFGHRRITISTAGMAPQIRRFAAEKHPYKLAVSLHATTNKTRSSLMPINRKYPLEELLDACKEYTDKTGNRLTFEYVLIDQVNDSLDDAGRLLKMLRPIPCKVNLIQYNSGGQKKYSASPPERVQAFSDIVRHLLAPVTLRLSKGDDIKGACGQLAGGK